MKLTTSLKKHLEANGASTCSSWLENKTRRRHNSSFPENIGSFLVSLSEENIVKTANSLQVALRKMVRDNYSLLLKIWVKARRWIAFLKVKKSKEMLNTYISVFSRLAKIYKTNIVVRTILIPEVHKLGSKITLTGYKVYNTCFVFNTKGRVAGIQQKEFSVL